MIIGTGRAWGRVADVMPTPSVLTVIARSAATKQSSRFDWLKAPGLVRDWIATAR